MAWLYNDAQVNGLAKLRPGNGLMSGAAAAGNALKSHVAPLAARTSVFAPPGANWAFQRSAGLEPRGIRWLWTLCATTEANLNTLESLIERYVEDGGAYAISDGVRSSSYVVLSEAQREQGLGRVRLPDGRFLQQWRLDFLVLAPARGATTF